MRSVGDLERAVRSANGTLALSVLRGVEARRSRSRCHSVGGRGAPEPGDRAHSVIRSVRAPVHTRRRLSAVLACIGAIAVLVGVPLTYAGHVLGNSAQFSARATGC